MEYYLLKPVFHQAFACIKRKEFCLYSTWDLFLNEVHLGFYFMGLESLEKCNIFMGVIIM